MFNDECRARIYDGLDATVWVRDPSESRTRTESPVVADVDNDGEAEWLFATNNESGFCSENLDSQYNNGIEVWGDANNTWQSARRIWNEHAYHVDNIDEDGSVPQIPAPSWLGHNTWRSNVAGPQADLSITQTDNPDPVLVGGDVTYTLQVDNHGPTASNASVLDTLPAGTVLVSAIPDQGSCTPGAGEVSCDLGQLLNGQTVFIAVTVTTVSPGLIVNSATVSGSVFDPNLSNNSDDEETTVSVASIGDMVWDDQDGDGIQDPGEPGVGDALVLLYPAVGNTPVEIGVTLPSGAYVLTSGLAGTEYRLRFVPPPGWAITQQDAGGDDDLDSDAEPVTGETAPFFLTSPADATRWDAGLIPYCVVPDEPIFIESVGLSTDGNNYPVLNYQDANQPQQTTGYNVYRSSNPALPMATWPLVASNVVDMDEATPNLQWVDSSGDLSPTGIWHYQITAWNDRCPAEGPF